MLVLIEIDEEYRDGKPSIVSVDDKLSDIDIMKKYVDLINHDGYYLNCHIGETSISDKVEWQSYRYKIIRL